METFDYLFCKAWENGKVAKALSEKLQTDVDKNKIVDEIGKIDISSIVQATIKDNAKESGVTFNSVTSKAETIEDYSYQFRLMMKELYLANATNIGNYAIMGCFSLENLDLPSAANVGSGICQDCISLKTLNLPNVTNVASSVVRNCVSLKTLNLSNATAIGASAMYNCMSLTNIELPQATTIGSSAMYNCMSLKMIKLGANQVATLANTNAFANTPISKGTGYIYVPDELVDSYKKATNWSVYADQIRPMSECEVE